MAARPSSSLYSPECVEGAYSAVRTQDGVNPLSLLTLQLLRQVASIPSDQLLHLVLQNKDSSQRIQTERFRTSEAALRIKRCGRLSPIPKPSLLLTVA